MLAQHVDADTDRCPNKRKQHHRECEHEPLGRTARAAKSCGSAVQRQSNSPFRWEHPQQARQATSPTRSWARAGSARGVEGTIARLDWHRLRVDHGEKAALLPPVAPLGAEGASRTHLLRVSRLRQIPRSHPDRTADLLVLRLSVWPHRTAFPPEGDSRARRRFGRGDGLVSPGGRGANRLCRFNWRNGVESPDDQPHRKDPQVVEDREEALTDLTPHAV